MKYFAPTSHFKRNCLFFLMGCIALGRASSEAGPSLPNVLFVLADQWRFDACGYAGNADVKTPNLDRLAREGVSFVNAVSGLPVCSPMRASLLTGQRPLTHGVFLNDVPLNPNANTIAKVLAKRGYDTGYIGKWHLNGDGRSAFIPRDRRQGFDCWKALECTHDYNHSYYFGDTPERREWKGYDAIAQTGDAQEYLRNHAKSSKPFFLMLAWGPPHDPYFTAPEKYRAMYDPQRLELRPNVPEGMSVQTRKILAGYYAHCTALDDCIGELLRTLAETGQAENTLVVFTSDHGDMLGSHGLQKKQKPHDESIRVPLLFRWPNGLKGGQRLDTPINSEDLMPTILALCGVKTPRSVEGLDFSSYLRGGKAPGDGAALVSCVSPFGEWDRAHAGKEYRGIRTARFTYVRDLNGPWLLFDNEADVFQTNNLVNSEGHERDQKQLERILGKKLRQQKDGFLPGAEYIKRWKYRVDANGTAPYER